MSDLLPRDVDILSLLISEYISTAEPIGSGTIASRSRIGLSSATIRNVMAKLEDLGLLSHPHTSAGRLPTAKGLKFYVSTIIGDRNLTEKEKTIIKKHFESSATSADDVLKRAGKIISTISNYTGLVVMPRPNDITFKHIEFIPLATGKILGIFVSREGLVHNRVIEVGEDFSYPELEKISNYCNSAYYGHSLEDAIGKATKEMATELSRYDRLISKAVIWSKELFSDASENELLVHGESKFLYEPEFADVNKLRDVMSALEERKGILKLLNSAGESDDVCVFIGSESGVAAISNCSIITTPYKKGGKTIGTLGVIGPTRMNYRRVIPTIDFTGKIVSEILKD